MALRTGGEVDAVCTRCKMVLAHTIIAMVGPKPVRVQCNTCGGQHNYRGKEETPARASRSASTSTATRAPRETPTRLSFEDILKQKTGLARPYSPKISFLLDEVVQHPTFGTGFVSAVRVDKIDVTFKSGVKTLVHGR